MGGAIQLLLALLAARVAAASEVAWLTGPAAPPLAVLVLAALVRWVGRLREQRLRRRLAKTGGFAERDVVRQWRVGMLLEVLPLGASVTAAVAGWSRWWGTYGLAGAPWLDELGLLLPYGLLVAVHWRHRWHVERLLFGRMVPWRGYVFFHSRQLVLPLLPVFLLLGLWDLLEGSPSVLRWLSAWPTLVPVGAGVFLAVLFRYSGPLVAALLGSRPLPAGPLRSRLESFAAEVGYPCRDLRVWETGLDVVNAAIVGGGRRRYVLFTDGLVRHFAPPFLEAVLAHELGHAAGRHLSFYFLFAVALLFLWSSLLGLATTVLPGLAASAWGQVIFFAGVLVVYWRVVFGFVSRQFEREADLFAALHLPQPEVFVTALEEVASRSGVGKALPSWRHASIGARTAFLTRALAEPAIREAFLRRVRRLKGALLLFFLGAVVLELHDLPAEIRAGRGFLRVVAALEADRPEEARREVRALLGEPGTARRLAAAAASYAPSAAPGGPGGAAWILYADLLLRSGAERAGRDAVLRILSVVEKRLEGGDVRGAYRLLRTLLRYRRGWGPAVAPKLDRLRRRLRAALAAHGVEGTSFGR